MGNTGPGSLSILVALSAILSHRWYFMCGEHHMDAQIWALGALVVPLILCYLIHSCWSWTWPSSLLGCLSLTTSWWSGFLSSVLFYRLLEHRLSKFPGSLPAKTTKLYHFYQCMRHNDYQFRSSQHATYGPIVRIGPNELSIAHPEAVQAIYGPLSRCHKSPWYDQGAPAESLHSVRDSKLHGQRRKIWDLGFSTKALRDFEPRQLAHIRYLGQRLTELEGQSINVSHWFNFLTFDIMGDLAFGKEFGMLDNGEEHYVMKLLHDGQKPLAFLTPVPWLTRVLVNIPGAMVGENKLKQWCLEQVEQRKKIQPDEPDIMSHLLQDAGLKSQEDADNWLTGDARLIVVAGSDTTALTLIHIFYYLARHKEILTKLRTSLDALISFPDSISHQDVQNIPYLDGIINETLRLHPPVPSGLLRVAPAEGLHCCGVFVPGGTTISVPLYVLGRSALAYKQAHEFIPERWHERQDLIIDKRAFAPFSSGKYSCVGKNLAMMQLRTTVAYLTLKFDFWFGSGEDGSRLFSRALDAFTIFPGNLNLVFRHR